MAISNEKNFKSSLQNNSNNDNYVSDIVQWKEHGDK